MVYLSHRLAGCPSWCETSTRRFASSARKSSICVARTSTSARKSVLKSMRRAVGERAKLEAEVEQLRGENRRLKTNVVGDEAFASGSLNHLDGDEDEPTSQPQRDQRNSRRVETTRS